jgi:AAHS family 4-hydroxybenzoate transporter-like MFS transporter
VDSQSIGVAGPLMAQDLKMTVASFGPVYSSGLLGAAIGAFAFGPISDRYGRRPTLVFTTFLFAIFTCLTPFAGSFATLLALRFIAGLGLGGATPCFITMSAEYAPTRSRAMLVSLLWAGYPLGNAVGGFMTSYLIKNFHWSMVFYAGGVPTLVIAVLLLFFMPESLRHLAQRGQSAAAEVLARKLDPALQGEIEIVTRRKEQQPKVSMFQLFTDGRATGTILLGLMLYFGFATTTVIVLQTPTILREAGIPLAVSAQLVATYSIVATLGMAIAGKLVERLGPVRALAIPFTGGAILLATLGSVTSSPLATTAVMMMLGLTVSVGSSGTIALAATFYPTAMRSAGTGWVMSLGRFGQRDAGAAMDARQDPGRDGAGALPGRGLRRAEIGAVAAAWHRRDGRDRCCEITGQIV